MRLKPLAIAAILAAFVHALECLATSMLSTCAILTFNPGHDVAEPEALSLGDRFAVEFDRFGQYRIVPRSRMREVLEEIEFQQSCTTAACAVEAGQLLGVRYMVYGTIARFGSLYTINSFMIDVETGAQLRSASTDVRGGIEEVLTQGMAANAAALLGMQHPAAAGATLSGTHDSDRRAAMEVQSPTGVRTVTLGQPFTLLLAPDIVLDFAYLPPGVFLMGSDSADVDQRTTHRVSVDHPFWVSRTPVTEAALHQILSSRPSDLGTDGDLPADRASWHDAVRFAQILQRQFGAKLPDGFEFRLPTVVEWEYACRAGTEGPYYFEGGFSALNRHAWHRGNSGFRKRRAGQLPPNPWGLLDMLGTVSEWCLDWYDAYPGTSRRNRFMGQTHKVVRGGDYKSPPHLISSSARTDVEPDVREDGIGFRIVIAKLVPNQ